MDLLLARGEQVRILDIRRSETHSDLWTPCDVEDPVSLASGLRGCTTVYNLAAVHRDDVRPLSRYREVNVEGARNVCDVCTELGIRRLIFTSSVAVFGFPRGAPDESSEHAPFNEYGRTKSQAEDVYRVWQSSCPSAPLVVVRPTVVFGEGNRGNVYNLLRQLASRWFVMVGSGENAKSMAYVGNVAAFLVHVIGCGEGQHFFNYVDKPDFRMRDLVRFVRGHLGWSPDPPLRVPYWLGYLFGTGLDAISGLSRRTFPITALRVRKFHENTVFSSVRVAATGFCPPYSIYQGLVRTLRTDFDRPAESGSSNGHGGE